MLFTVMGHILLHVLYHFLPPHVCKPRHLTRALSTRCHQCPLQGPDQSPWVLLMTTGALYLMSPRKRKCERCTPPLPLVHTAAFCWEPTGSFLVLILSEERFKVTLGARCWAGQA